jgi:hypothetical protein
VTTLRRALAAIKQARPPKPKRRQEEHSFQATLFEFLDLALPAEAIATSIDHANAASAVTGALRARRGVLPGIPGGFK